MNDSINPDLDKRGKRKGGSNTVRNIQLLCEKCNRSKSNKI